MITQHLEVILVMIKHKKISEHYNWKGMKVTFWLVDASAPTCADDMTLLSPSPTRLQAMIWIAQRNASMERYQ